MRKTYVFMIITLLTIVFLPHYSYAARVLFVPASTVVWGGDTPSNQDLEDKQKLLEEKQKELEAKQAELEKKQAELETKSEAKAEAKVEVKEEKKAEKVPTEEVEKAKLWLKLKNRLEIVESLAVAIKSKDEATQKKISLILETFKVSDDEYTRNIGFYLSYLLK